MSLGLSLETEKSSFKSAILTLNGERRRSVKEDGEEERDAILRMKGVCFIESLLDAGGTDAGSDWG